MTVTAYGIRDAQMDDVEAIVRVHVASWRTTYAPLIEASWFDQMERHLDDRLLTRREQLGQIDAHTLVMTSPGGLVVGFADVGPLAGEDSRFDGELYAIYILSGWQGFGGGRALVTASAVWLAERGYRAMKVWVLTENHPARVFYERLGAELVDHRVITIGMKTLPEDAYGWHGLTTLA